MKRLNAYINESQTSSKNIQNYGKSWTIEWMPDQFNEMLNFFISGLSEGLEDNLKAYKNNIKEFAATKENIKLIEEIKNLINKSE